MSTRSNPRRQSALRRTASWMVASAGLCALTASEAGSIPKENAILVIIEVVSDPWEDYYRTPQAVETTPVRVRSRVRAAEEVRVQPVRRAVRTLREVLRWSALLGIFHSHVTR